MIDIQCVLTRSQAINWCVAKLAHWPRPGQVNFHPEPNGWQWVDGAENGFHLFRYGYSVIEKDSYDSAVGKDPIIMADDEFTGNAVDVSEKVEALALRLFERRLKETVGNPQEVARWAIVNARFFYDVVGGVE